MRNSNIMLQIGSLLDSHSGEIQNCQGCEICTLVRELGEELEQRSRVNQILAKGPDMTKSEIEYLVSKEVTNVVIQKALDLGPGPYQKMMMEFGIDISRKYFEMTEEEYKGYIAQGMSHYEIANLRGVGLSTITEWKRRLDFKNKKMPFTKRKYKAMKRVGKKDSVIAEEYGINKKHLALWKKANFDLNEIKNLMVNVSRKKVAQ